MSEEQKPHELDPDAFWLVWIPDGDEPVVEGHPDADALAARVRALGLIEQFGFLWFFRGERLPFTSGPTPCLVAPDGRRISLVEPQLPGDPSDDARIEPGRWKSKLVKLVFTGPAPADTVVPTHDDFGDPIDPGAAEEEEDYEEEDYEEEN